MNTNEINVVFFKIYESLFNFIFLLVSIFNEIFEYWRVLSSFNLSLQ